MFTANLEKELIRQNKKILLPENLLIVKEYEKQTDLIESDVLERTGFNRTLKKGREIIEHTNSRKSETEKFDQSRVFHISQIKAICKKYYLKFLNVGYYHGSIDKELPNKITNFEAIYNIKCSIENLYIIAPAESFNLEPKPKDPLLFYVINSEYFYLIHKWGNDLNIFRRILSLLTKKITAVIMCIGLPIFILNRILFNIYSVENFASRAGQIGFISFVNVGIIAILYGISYYVLEELNDDYVLLKKNEYNSRYY